MAQSQTGDTTDTSTDDEPAISTVNTNARHVETHKLRDRLSEPHEMLTVFNNVSTARDLCVLVNRIIDEFGSVTGTTKVSEDVYIVYHDRY